MEYNYDSSKDHKELTSEAKFNTRLAGVALILFGLLQFYSHGWTEAETKDKLLIFPWIVIGVIYIAFPLWASKPFGLLKKEYLIIDSKKLEWNIGDRENVTQIRIDDIKGWTTNVGEVHFETKSGGTHKLSTHKIYGTEKHKAFYKILNDDLKNQVS